MASLSNRIEIETLKNDFEFITQTEQVEIGEMKAFVVIVLFF